MPQITQVNTLDISPEKFLNACSKLELYETWLLMQSNRYQKIIFEMENSSPVKASVKQLKKPGQ